jgi:hypothetical protein
MGRWGVIRVPIVDGRGVLDGLRAGDEFRRSGRWDVDLMGREPRPY